EAGPDMREYHRRMSKLAGQPVTFRVVRREKDADGKDVIADITVAPAYRADIGARMKMAKVAAVRAGSPAEKAGVQPVPLGEPPNADADQIVEVSVTEPDGTTTRYIDGDVKKEPGQPGVTVKKLDPILLPLELKKWADRNPKDRNVRLVVLRTVGHEQGKRVE